MRIIKEGSFSLGYRRRQKHQDMPASTSDMKIPASLSSQEAKAIPVAAANNAKPNAIHAVAESDMGKACFINPT